MPDPTSPLDLLKRAQAAYDDYCERSLNEDDVYDAAMQCADDVPALLAALAEAQRERDEQRKLTAVCTCYDGNPANYEGAHADCMVHGSIRAFHEATSELAAVRSDVGELRSQRDFAMRELREKTQAYDVLSTEANTRLVRAVTAEAERERMRPVVEKAQRWRAWLADELDNDQAETDLAAAVDTYEKTQEGTDG